MAAVSTHHARYLGKSVGTGHCVSLIREVTGLPETAQWRRGIQCWGATRLDPGVAIATFDPDGRYGNHVDGRSHAAILLAVTSDGLLVMDQWLGQPVHERTIRFRAGRGDACNDGQAFHVIELADDG